MIRYQTYIIPVHPDSYRHKGYENQGEIIGVHNVMPNLSSDFRICYVIIYPDGFEDYVPISEVECGNYKIVGRNES